LSSGTFFNFGLGLSKMRNIMIESLSGLPVFEHQVEIVERKGKGHPDSICDAVMEKISVALSKEYQKNFGRILHHNIDKGLLVAGQVERKFGGGCVKKPMKLYIGDRATFEAEGVKIPVEEMAIKAAKGWIRDNLRFVDSEKDLRYFSELHPSSEELAGIFLKGKTLLPANDTSAAVGYAPLTETELVVLKTEDYLNSSNFKKKFPETGEDVKVMGYRVNKELNLTVAMPLISRFVDSESDYFAKKGKVIEDIENFLSNFDVMEKINVELNTLDVPGKGLDGIYLSVLGTSAEDADSGEVGRGNRVNGVISLNRPMGTEAAAGKNPVSHVGKIYNFLSHKIANEIYSQVNGIREIYVWLCSQIGNPIDEPKVASVQVVLKKGVSLNSVSNDIRDVTDCELSKIGDFCQDLIEGKYPVC